MPPSRSDREQEPYRWCVFCDADCDVDEADHAPECPSSTGIYPVQVHKHCETCSCDGTTFCCDCGAELKVGDFYMHREIGEEGISVREVICIGCKAGDAIGDE